MTNETMTPCGCQNYCDAREPGIVDCGCGWGQLCDVGPRVPDRKDYARDARIRHQVREAMRTGESWSDAVRTVAHAMRISPGIVSDVAAYVNFVERWQAGDPTTR